MTFSLNWKPLPSLIAGHIARLTKSTEGNPNCFAAQALLNVAENLCPVPRISHRSFKPLNGSASFCRTLCTKAEAAEDKPQHKQSKHGL